MRVLQIHRFEDIPHHNWIPIAGDKMLTDYKHDSYSDTSACVVMREEKTQWQ